VYNSFVNKESREQKPVCLIVKLLVIIGISLPLFLFGEDLDMNKVRADEEFHYGVDAYHFGLFGKALQSFELALSYVPDNELIKTWLGRTYYRMGFEDTALSIWDELLSAGKGTSLLENQKKVIELRRGLGRELLPEEHYVVHTEIDANVKEYYSFKRPSSIAMRADGTFYVIAYGSGEIVNFNANSLAVNIKRGGLESYNHPFDLLEVGDFIFVTEFEGNRITKCTADFQKIKSFGQKGIKEGELLGPQFLAVDEHEYLYVTDWGNGRISKFDLEGEFVLSFGSRTRLFPDLLKPTGIAVWGENVYVADHKKRRIVVFDTSGNYLDEFGQGELFAPEGLLFYDERTLLVADTTRIMKYDLENEVWSEWSDVSNMAKRVTNLDMTVNGDVLAVDFDLNKVFVISNMTTLYTGYFTTIDRVDARNFPDVSLDITVEDWYGKPIVGLTRYNFFITEFQNAIPEATLALSAAGDLPLSIVVLIESSPELSAYREYLVEAVKTLNNLVSGNDRIKIITASDIPIVNAEFGRLPANVWEEIMTQKSEKFWRLDLAARKAVDDLLAFRGKKAVIYLTGANLPVTAFKDFSLDEITNYMENNGISFYPVYFGEQKSHEELDYMARETKARSIYYFNPAGIKSVITYLKSKKSATYVITFTSPTDPQFGERYIDFSVQVMLYSKTGKDACGYFAPRQY
jgi:DNA-binding beta-propeller fold protein YncE